MEPPKRVMTKHYPETVDKNKATEIYNYLRDNIKWHSGVPSKITGFTRLAKALDVGDNRVVDDILIMIMQKLGLNYHILGIYLNYYKDGTHYTPSHSHKGQTQLVVSLGVTRTLKVGKKDYQLSNGDAIIFGSSAHSVPSEPNVKEGRISIATFMQPYSPMYILLPEEEAIKMLKDMGIY
jgi:hypothetical protein